MTYASFLLTDIEGSTRLLARLEDRYLAHLEESRRLLRHAIGANDGRELGTEGDSMLAVFERPGSAVRAALEGQVALKRHSAWNEDERPRVRMGLHCGEVRVVADEYFGLALHQVARISSAAHGDQILASPSIVSSATGYLGPDESIEKLGSYRLKDFDDPVELFQINGPFLPTNFPALRTRPAAVDNLPISPTSFIGREQEVGHVSSLLRSHRLVTLTGAGGSGKTRLALEIARDLGEDFEDGIWMVDLSDTVRGESVVEQLAAALGLREQPGSSLLAIVVDALLDQRTLLLIDNCEHLLPAVRTAVTTLITRCPSVGVLATSREPLGVNGEVLLPVPPLRTAQPQDVTCIADLARYEAAQLFLERSLHVAPNLRLEDGDAPFIAQLCQRLDGIPLAIELASPLLRMLTPQQMNDRLEQRHILLVNDAVSSLRHRTLENVIDWSYSSLSPAQRMLYERFGIFHGGWTLPAAEEVCSGQHIAPEEVLPLLTQLVDKSLVGVSRFEGELRYHLLESIRLHALERLERSGQLKSVARRHRDFYLRFMEELDFPSVTENESVLDQIRLDLGNLRAAVDWTVAHQEPDAALRIAPSLWGYCTARGNVSDIASMMERMLSAPGPKSRDLAGTAMAVAGSFKLWQGHVDQALELFTEALPITRAAGVQEVGGPAFILSHLGDIELKRGLVEAAKSSLEEGLRLTLESGNAYGSVYLLLNLASVDVVNGHLDAARERAGRALATGRTLNSKRSIAMALHTMSLISLLEGDLQSGRSSLRDGVHVAREAGGGELLSRLLRTLGQIEFEKGDWEAARACWVEALQAADECGDRLETGLVLAALALLLASDGDDVTARRWRRAAESVLTPAVDHKIVDPDVDLFVSWADDRLRAASGGEPTDSLANRIVAESDLRRSALEALRRLEHGEPASDRQFSP